MTMYLIQWATEFPAYFFPNRSLLGPVQKIMPVQLARMHPTPSTKELNVFILLLYLSRD